jgi:Flp pilus assembly protein TadG
LRPFSSTRFRRNASGGVAILTALASIPLFGMVGLTVDYVMMVHRKQTMQQSLDAATLAAAKALQMTGSEEQATQTFDNYFKFKRDAVAGVVPKIVTIDLKTNTIVTEADISHTNYVMGILGFDSSEIKTTSSAQTGPLDELEISLMLDLSSSMTGWRYDELKVAAAAFVDILKPDNSTSNGVRIALSPFSSGVNVGSYLNQVRDPAAPPATNTCVPVRTGAAALTDAPPSPGAYFGAYTDDSDWPCVESQILPLEADSNVLQARIAALKLSAGTEGEIGTAWAWYLLSPDWSAVWPAASRPKPYNTPVHRKIALLLTDGENFTRYFPDDEDADMHAMSLCDGMKAQGITIFSVAVGVEGSRAEDLLRNCASDPSKYLDVQNEGEMTEAFKKIALLLSPLRLTN